MFNITSFMSLENILIILYEIFIIIPRTRFVLKFVLIIHFKFEPHLDVLGAFLTMELLRSKAVLRIEIGSAMSKTVPNFLTNCPLNF